MYERGTSVDQMMHAHAIATCDLIRITFCVFRRNSENVYGWVWLRTEGGKEEGKK